MISVASIGNILDIRLRRGALFAWSNVPPEFMPPHSHKSNPSDLPPKRAKFRELAESRTNRAIEAIRRIGNLANQQLYEYEPVEVKKVLRALRAAIADVEGRFTAPGRKPDRGFKL